MSSPRKSVMILGITLSTASMCAAALDVDLLSHGCRDKINPLSDYQSLVEQVSRDLINLTPIRSFNYYNEREDGEITSYGHGICRSGISGDECTTCLHVANVQRIQVCGFVMASQITLKDCHMRIDEDDFKWNSAESII